jgi:hypothetical protein
MRKSFIQKISNENALKFLSEKRLIGFITLTLDGKPTRVAVYRTLCGSFRLFKTGDKNSNQEVNKASEEVVSEILKEIFS